MTHPSELSIHPRPDLVEFSQDRMLDDVNADLSAKDLGTAPQQKGVGPPAAAVAHVLCHHKEQREAQVETLHHVLAGHNKQLGGVKALEDGACNESHMRSCLVDST